MIGILWAFMAFSEPSDASLRTWWYSWCERVLVSDDPAEKPMQLTHEEQTTLIQAYRRIGGEMYWGRSDKRRDLQDLGFQLRQMDRDDARQALRDYEKFE